MINYSEVNRRVIIPQWLEFYKAVSLGELAYDNNVKSLPNGLRSNAIEKLRKDYSFFQKEPMLSEAIDLIGNAFILKEPTIINALSKYILKNQKGLNKVSLDLLNNIEISQNQISQGNIYLKVKKLKQYLSDFPKNAFKWIELGRLYTILGHNHKSKNAVITALALEPSNRYIVRSGIRFFFHISDLDSAYYFLKKALYEYNDPWLQSINISVALLLKKRTPKFEKINIKEISKIDVFQLSELIESIGTLEINSGNVKKAKKYYYKAWENPPRTVIAHSEWVLRNHFFHLINSIQFDFSNSPEASAYNQYHNINYSKALSEIIKWINEEPYSKEPYILASSIYCSMEKYKKAIEIADSGLKSNPNDFTLLNNKCYALLKNNEVKVGEKQFSYLNKPSESSIEYIIYSATKGLLKFKKGDITNGRNLYLLAIEKSNILNNQVLKLRAQLNLLHAELEHGNILESKILNETLNIAQKSNDPQIVTSLQKFKKKIKRNKKNLHRVT